MAKTPEEEHPIKANGWAARDSSGVLSPFKFSRRETGEKDVRFRVLYCGICHSDLHMVKNEWGTSIYPLVPGHEIVGEVTEVGSRVKKVKVGVGCAVGACHSCENCNNDLEVYCPKMILSYGACYYDGTVTYGGYSETMVANERYILRISSSAKPKSDFTSSKQHPTATTSAVHVSVTPSQHKDSSRSSQKTC